MSTSSSTATTVGEVVQSTTSFVNRRTTLKLAHRCLALHGFDDAYPFIAIVKCLVDDPDAFFMLKPARFDHRGAPIQDGTGDSEPCDGHGQLGEDDEDETVDLHRRTKRAVSKAYSALADLLEDTGVVQACGDSELLRRAHAEVRRIAVLPRACVAGRLLLPPEAVAPAAVPVVAGDTQQGACHNPGESEGDHDLDEGARHHNLGEGAVDCNLGEGAIDCILDKSAGDNKPGEGAIDCNLDESEGDCNLGEGAGECILDESEGDHNPGEREGDHNPGEASSVGLDRPSTTGIRSLPQDRGHSSRTCSVTRVDAARESLARMAHAVERDQPILHAWIQDILAKLVM